MGVPPQQQMPPGGMPPPWMQHNRPPMIPVCTSRSSPLNVHWDAPKRASNPSPFLARVQGMAPPGMMPPGMAPPGMMGMAPPGMMPMPPMHGAMPPGPVAPGIAKLGDISGFLAAKKAQEEAAIADAAAKEAAKERVRQTATDARLWPLRLWKASPVRAALHPAAARCTSTDAWVRFSDSHRNRRRFWRRRLARRRTGRPTS